MMVYTINKGDYGFALNFTCTDSTGTALNITAATVTLKMKTSKLTGTAKISAACTLDVPASGTCHYTLIAADTDTADTYVWELEIDYGTKLITCDGDSQIIIKDNL